MALQLSPRQRRMANLIMRIGSRRGIPRNRLGELAFAAYKESGLNPRAQGPAVSHSGYGGARAAGLFQLLSSGYVNQANEMGGVFNPRANILAILPSYKQYWQQNPGAAPGAAARDVERSGMGAEWYAPTSEFNTTLGSLPSGNQTLRPSANVDPVRLAPLELDRSQLLGSILEMIQTTQQTGQVDVSGVVGAYRDMMAQAQEQRSELPRQPGSTMPGGGTEVPGHGPIASGPGKYEPAALAEAFYDPIGQWDNGRFSTQGIGGHSDHVHLSITNPRQMVQAIKLAQRLGLSARENPYVDPVDPVHVEGSFHYQTGGTVDGRPVGKGLDVSGPSEVMDRYYRMIMRRYGLGGHL